MDRYDLVLAAIPVVALGPIVVGTLARLAGGDATPIELGPGAAIGPLIALGLVAHQLLVDPPNDVDDS